MTTERILIRGGHVLTLDAAGDLPAGDVLIEGERIAAVAPRVDAGGARIVDARDCIVMPGFVDTHRHTWQTQMRGLCADWTLTDYFFGMRLAISPSYEADDVHVGNLAGALDALNAGVTTILDFSHCMNSPEHADAAIGGLKDAGIRALHCYGYFASSPLHPAFPSHALRRADFERIVRAHGTTSGLVRVGVALTEVGAIPWADTVAEIESARRHDAHLVTHTGCVWGSLTTGGIQEMRAHGLLGPEQVHVHCNTLDDADWRALAAAGCKVSISPETELNMGMGRLVFDQCRTHGIAPTLSCDIISLNSGDLFTQMRLGLAYQRFVDNDVVNQAGGMPVRLTSSARDALVWGTINGAAACGLDAEVGTLRPGKQADVIVLGGDGFSFRPRHDVAGSVVFQATARDVRDVFVAGRAVKRDGALVGVDLPALHARAEASAARVMERVRAIAPVLPPPPIPGFDFNEVARANLAGAKA